MRGSSPHVDLVLDDEAELMIKTLPRVLEVAEEVGLRHIRVPGSALDTVMIWEEVAAFNMRWDSCKSCTRLRQDV